MGTSKGFSSVLYVSVKWRLLMKIEAQYFAERSHLVAVLPKAITFMPSMSNSPGYHCLLAGWLTAVDSNMLVKP